MGKLYQGKWSTATHAEGTSSSRPPYSLPLISLRDAKFLTFQEQREQRKVYVLDHRLVTEAKCYLVEGYLQGPVLARELGCQVCEGGQGIRWPEHRMVAWMRKALSRWRGK